MAWDYYTILARRDNEAAHQDLDIIAVYKNEEEYRKRSGNRMPKFDDEETPDGLKDCVYLGGAEKDPQTDACRWLWGRWW